MNRRSPVKIHRRAYTRWLKSLDRATFDLAPEQAERDQLQAVLDANPALATWGPNRADEAVFLINDTWKALLGLATGAEVLERNEAWARARGEAASVQHAGSSAIVNPFAVETLSRRSQARTAVRLGAFELSDDQIAQVGGSMAAALPVVGVGRVHVLVGPFGSGKSELAERWHRSSIRELTHDWADAPFAVWLSARAIDRSFDATISDWVGRSESAARRGADIVLDGLDETDTARAVDLIDAARVFLAGSPRSRVLITARETFGAGATEVSQPPKLSAASVEHILSILTGQPISLYSLPAAVRDAVATPFFAVAAGSVLRSGRTVGGNAGIINQLVELALARPLDGGVAVSDTLAPLLKNLAVQSTNSGLGVSRRSLLRGEVNRALMTRLVIADGERLSFSLPIFQQWFAAQAVIEGTTTVDASTAEVFDRWRWSLALAASVAPPSVADHLLATLTRANPAAAAWTVTNAVSNFLGPGLENAEASALDAGRRLGVLYRDVRSSLGDLGTRLFPTNGHGDLATIGVNASDRGVVMSWKVGLSDEPVVELPPDVHPFRPDPRWNGFRSKAPRAESCWLWTFAFDDLAANLDSMLITDKLPADSPVWRAEHFYSVCRSIVGSRNSCHPPIPVADLLSKVDPHLDRGAARVTFGRGFTMTNDELVRFRADLLAVTNGQVARPWPIPDLTHAPRGGGGWVGDDYSEPLTRQLVFDVYSGALEIYRTWATTWFAPFDWALGILTDTRIGFLGTVEFPDRENHPMPVPGLSYLILPIAALDEFVPIESHLGALGSPVRIGITNDDPWPGFDNAGALANRTQWIGQHGNPVFGGFTSGSGGLYVYNDRPATRIALTWLMSDLKSFGLKLNARVPEGW